jgi:hypothetical protein
MLCQLHHPHIARIYGVAIDFEDTTADLSHPKVWPI